MLPPIPCKFKTIIFTCLNYCALYGFITEPELHLTSLGLDCPPEIGS